MLKQIGPARKWIALALLLVVVIAIVFDSFGSGGTLAVVAGPAFISFTALLAIKPDDDDAAAEGQGRRCLG